MDVKSLAGRWEQQSQDQNKLWEEQIKRRDERYKQFHELMASFRERKGMYTNCLTEVPRRDLPIFEGINPRLWLRQCNKYFKVYNIPENQRMEVASLYMVGKPKVWMSSYMEIMKGADWTDVICCLVGNYRDKIGLDIEDQEFKKWEDSFLENYRVDCEGLWKNGSETIPEKHDYLSLEDDHEEKVVADVVMDQKDIQEHVPVEKFLGEAEIAEEDVIDVLLEKLEMFDGVLVRDFDNAQSEDGAKKDTMEVNKDIHDWVKSDLWTELSNGGELCKFIECHDVVDYAFTGNLDFVFVNGRKVKPLPWRDKIEVVFLKPRGTNKNSVMSVVAAENWNLAFGFKLFCSRFVYRVLYYKMQYCGVYKGEAVVLCGQWNKEGHGDGCINTAGEVGTYFVGQYYNVLQNTPEVVHHFYTDASNVVCTDGNIRETASAMVQINALIMSLNYTGIEVKTANSLESWNGGVLIMVSGSVLLKDFNGRRKFVQTFFLAPQESGFFVLSDIFHFIEEDLIHQHSVAYIAPSIHDPKLHASNANQESVPTYMLSGDFQAREFVGSSNAKKNPPSNNYSFSEQQLPQVPETDSIIKGNFAVQSVHSNGSLQSTLNPVQEHPSSPVEEPAEEPHKHTYASILQVSKGHSVAVHAHSSFKKTPSPASEWEYVPEPSSNQKSFTSSVDSFGREAVEQVSVVEDVKIKSVYVRNVPSTVSASEIEQEFKKFGRLKPDGVAIRTRQPKELGECYAFVEFEDAAGVQNAIKASTVEIGGQQAFIEERKADRINVFRGGRGRGRSRGSYHMDSSKGRFSGRNFSRGSGQNGDYSRPRGNGNGYHRPSQRQERVFSGNQQVSRNGHNSSE